MMSSILFALNTIEQWLSILVFGLVPSSIIGLLVWEAILEIRYDGPFTLVKTSNKEKWRRAIVLALMLTSMLPIFGLAIPILSTPPEKLSMFLFCNGIWIIALPIAILYKRLEFEMHIKVYKYFDKLIKDKNSIYYHPSYPSIFTSLSSLQSLVMWTDEQKRFYNEGFPDDIDDNKEMP